MVWLQVFALTNVSVNMFVAVITTVFMDVRSIDNPGGGLTTSEQAKQAKKAATAAQQRDAWTAPWYFVAAMGGEGPYVEGDKENPRDRNGLIWCGTAIQSSTHARRPRQLPRVRS